MVRLEIQRKTPAAQAVHITLPPAPNAKLPQFINEPEPWVTGFFRRLKEFLTERPVKLPPNAGPAALGMVTFGAGFRENLREFFRPVPPALRGPVHSRYAVEWSSPGRVFWQNLRDLVAPPKLSPLRLTSKPVKVRDIWSKNENFGRVQSLSFLVHVLAGLILILPFVGSVLTPTQAGPKLEVMFQPVDISEYLPKLPPGDKKAGGGGGGGERSQIPASKGRLPKFSLQPQLTPPVVQIQNPNPKLPVDPTVFVPPDIRVPQPNLPNYGDPLAAMVTNSSGPGSGGGIGTGEGGGVGSGSGPGVGPGWGGGIGGGPFQAGRNGVGYPACAYCPNPQFSEEARKAKHMGTVLLRLIVQPDGRATDISVVKGLGLGLDEKAIEAVRTWRFKPAIGPGNKPVAVWVDIEVVFRIL